MDSDLDIEKITSFQNIAGIDDFELAVDIMRNFNWNLDEAINNYVCEPDVGIPTDNSVSLQHPERQDVSINYPGNVEMHSPESDGDKNLEFRIHLPSTGTTEDFVLPDSRSLLDLKEELIRRCGEQILLLMTASQERADITTQNLVSAIRFDGLRTGYVSDETAPLRSLHLPHNNYLTALLLPRVAHEPSPPVPRARRSSFEFKIRVSSPSSSSASSTSSTRSRETSRRNGHQVSTPDCSDNDTSEQIVRSGPDSTLMELGVKAESVTKIPSHRQLWSLPSSISGSHNLEDLVKDLNLFGRGDSTKAVRTLDTYGLQPGGSYTLQLQRYSRHHHENSRGTSSSSSSFNQVSTSTSSRGVHTNAHRGSVDRPTSSAPQSSSSTGSLAKSSSFSRGGDRHSNRQWDFKRKTDSRGRGRSNGLVVMEDDETDYTEYIDDDYLQLTDDLHQCVNNVPLIPLELIDSPILATENFSSVFLQRYCRDGAELPPPFACCRLDEALDGAFKTPSIADRKPLFIYLHDDNSVGAHIFATRVLCSVELHQFFSNNDITIWPWDVTLEQAKAKVLLWLQPRLEWLANKLRSTPKDDFPLLVMVVKLAGSLEVLYILNGRGVNLPTPNRGGATIWSSDQEMIASFPALGSEDAGVQMPASSTTAAAATGSLKPDEVATELWNSLAQFMTRLEPELDAEKERIEREQVRAEQDHAYRESLRQDQLKMKAKKEEEEDIRRKEKLQQLEAEREKAAALAECRRLSAALPPEPPAPGTPEAEAFARRPEGAAGIATLRFRLPPGLSLPPLFDLLPEGERPAGPPANGMLIRRFRGLDTLADLKHYMGSLGFTVANFKLLTTFPRTDLTATADDRVTVAELKLVPQETLILEER